MSARIFRALNERIYLLKANQEPTNWNFEVRGQTNKVYKVKLVNQEASQCTCMDFILRKKFCKHLIFITERIAKLTSVTYRMLDNNYLAKEDFESLNNNLRHRLVNSNDTNTNNTNTNAPVDTTRKVSETSDDCFICFDSLQGETLVQCVTTCKNYFHEACLKIWLSKNNTCPLCRADWHTIPINNRTDGADDALDYLEQPVLKPVIKLRLKHAYIAHL